MATVGYRPLSLRAIEAAERRQQREAKKRFRELERQAKKQARLSQLEQARLEVERYENRLEILLSIHKEQGERWDWSSIAADLPPPCPQKLSFHELKARQRLAVAFDPPDRENWEAEIERAQLLDEGEFQQSITSYTLERAQWERLHAIYLRIISGEYKAYADALLALEPLAEISELGSSVEFIAHSAKLLECALKVNGVDAIPNEVNTLTSGGKLSVKPMPRSQFHEIYQDYVCGCMLRVAREVFAFLPVETLLITAYADLFDPSTGQTQERPVVSAVIHRTAAAKLDFERLDPSDAVDSFQGRGDFKATRKSGAFLPITPLTPSEILQETPGSLRFDELLTKVRQLRMELQEECGELGVNPAAIS